MEYLNKLKNELEKIASVWDGDDNQEKEDRARAALECLVLLDSVKDIVEELNIK